MMFARKSPQYARPSRAETLRHVLDVVEERRDGVLPMDLPAVRETFADELDLLGALQLRWHTRLAGRIEAELVLRPTELDEAVVTAWRDVAVEMPGLRAVLDHYRDHPTDSAMAVAMTKATAKERVLLAVMAGRSGVQGSTAAVRVGERLEQQARDLPVAVAA